MNNICKKQKISTLLALLALTVTPTAWAYDSAVNFGVGQFALDYQDQTRSVSGKTTGWHLGYVGRFNEYLGFEVRWGGASETSTAGLAIKPALFLSPLFRPSIPLGETVELYGLLGFTALAVARTPAGNTEEAIGRAGGSIGLGADFHFTKHLVGGVELVSYQKNVDYGPKSNKDNWTGVTSAKVSLSGITANFKYQF